MERRYKFIGLFIALAIFFSVLIFSPVFHTGFYVSEESEYDNLDKTWNFSNPENYSYNSSEISLAEGGASLKQIVTVFNWTEVSTLDYNLSSAFYNSKDKTNKIDSLGNGHIKPSSNKILDISFENELTNGDIINIYILSSSSGEIYICKAGSLCNFAEYGSVSHDGNEGFYNITISGLTDPTDSFRLVANKIKIDFIKALDINVTNHSFVNVTYPASSTIETEDIVDLKNIDSLEFLSSLNNQSINYSYSSDSGLTWNNILEDVSILNVSKIRFSAKLLSDTLGTPILEKIILIYDEMPEENSTNIKFSYTVNLTSNEPTTINSSNIFLDIMISKNVSYANITIEEIEDIPLESKKPLRSPIDLTVDDNT
ncbi:MAG: hypothetical protein KKB79_00320, partial [Nanoarchaeota archaeon]|nr:hypothetical protein [Nanoarchaeota archaeon]